MGKSGVVYCAGERESCGKDAEGAMALSLGKPVVFYCNQERRRRFYRDVHPLSRLIEFETGVAVGAMVTDSLSDVSELLYRIFENKMRYPLLEKLGIERCGFHAFRHGNETVMDGEGVPMATRQNRLGHSDAHTTMRYTHVISEDGRKIAARFRELLTCSPTAALMPAGSE
jgi:integrase